MSLYRELKRRKVFRVGILYVASAWLLLQLTDVLSSLLSLPASTGPIVVFLLVFGFIPAMVIAWVFEWTPEGLKRDSEIDRSEAAAPSTGRKVSAIIVAILIAGIGVFAFNKLTPYMLPDAEVTAIDPTDVSPAVGQAQFADTPSIAVLPFENLSADTEQGFFAAGMTEDIITNLTYVRGMRVISLNSTSHYENTDTDSQQIGNELGVRHILKGSVRKSGDQLRITAQLIDSTNSASVVWADQWDRPVSDFFALQDDITARIINELEIKLVEGEQRRIAQQSTSNPDAYTAVRRGIVAFETLPKTLATLAEARNWFKRAFELDPEYATAIAWFAWGHLEEVVQDISVDPEASLARAEEWTKRAREIDDSLPEVYDSLGSISFLRGELDKAYEFQLRALELAPGHADVSVLMGDTLTVLGRPAEALTYVKKGLDLNPFPPWYYWNGLGQAHTHLENYSEALEPTKKSLDMFPEFEHTRVLRIIQLVALEREDEARIEARDLMQLNPNYRVGQSPYLHLMTNHELRDQFYDYLREAGLE